jgi:hypothetical protein
MASITSWTRLEPRTRGERLTSVQARIADPLWLLGRQWQIGELQGEDAGSPVEAELRYTASALSRYIPTTPGPAIASPLPADVPLEVLVEAEGRPTSSDGTDLRAAVEGGRRLLELLGAQAATYAGPLAAAYGLPPPDPDEPADPEAGRLRALAAGRLPDARRLWPPLSTWRRSGGTVPAAFTAADQDALDAVDAWLAWYETRPVGGVVPPAAWRPERLEHEFSLAAHTTGPGLSPILPASTETVLVATDYGARELDWHALDVWAGQILGALDDPAPKTTTPGPMLPTRVTFPGMPVPRWWQLEEADVDLTALRPGPEDLGRLLFTEFALNYGNDFFWLPFDLPVGSVTAVESLRVTTSFGDVIDVPAAAEADRAAGRVVAGGAQWAMFQPTVVDGGAVVGASNLLVLLPTGSASLHGEPVEEILLSRDEMANVAWALERQVPGPSGRPVDRHELWQRSRPDPEPAPGVPHEPVLSYELATALPPYWLPLLNQPGPAGTNRSVLLRLEAVSAPVGTLLHPGFTLWEESLTRTGIRVFRHRKRTRYIDGRVHTWTARQSDAGFGESTSGLRFDDLRSQ